MLVHILWYPFQLGAELSEHLTIWPAHLTASENGGTGSEHLPHHLLALDQGERAGLHLVAVGEGHIISTPQISRSPSRNSGQFGPFSPMLGNKCDDKLFILLAELALDGAEEDLGPVE